MCGLTGLVAPPGEAPDRRRLQAMTAALSHRGPDADGYLVDGNLGLGHRRLSVIDTRDVANQPLFSEDEAVAVMFNGEIYNFRDLVDDLEAAGHRFATRTDTEVLVHGWEEWGEDLVPRLRGMFAFALWDRRQRLLFLARDRMGQKPLYYRHDPLARTFAFASEIGALRVGASGPPEMGELDLAAVGEYLVYGNTVGERSVFRRIRRLLPGTTLTFRPDHPGLPPVRRRYWTYRPEGGHAVDRDPDPVAYLHELETRLTEATRMRLMADVPLGAFLSGGVDSSLVVALMARESSGPVSTFAIGFEEEAWNEAPHARAVAEFLGTDHHEEIVTQDALAASRMLPELVATYGEPFGDPSAIPTWHLARMTRRHVTVALSGDGGDELFYGYKRYRETATLARAARAVGPAGRFVAGRLGRVLPVDSWTGRALGRAALGGGRTDGFELYHHAMGWSEPFLSLLAPEVRRALGEGDEQTSAADFRRAKGLALLERAQQMDLGNYLPDQVLVKVDRASMRHSLEVRCPLLDARVVDWAARAPASLQMEHDGKALLRSLAYRYVPRSLIERPKQGFSVPLREWFRRDLAPLMQDALDDDSNLAWRVFDRTEARRRFHHHFFGRANNETALWRLLFFSEWARRS